MENVLIVWDREAFDSEKRLLPNSNKLYTQIYGIPEKGKGWTLVFEFEETPRNQGYRSKAKVHFLVPEAPHDILKPGFKFDFWDGASKVGHCEIVAAESIKIDEIHSRILQIQDEQRKLRDDVNSIEIEDLGCVS
jgi:hypothetical protein